LVNTLNDAAFDHPSTLPVLVNVGACGATGGREYVTDRVGVRESRLHGEWLDAGFQEQNLFPCVNALV
jgi:hypothetical protein